MRFGSAAGVGGSAGRMEREKSVLAVRRTREEGKKRREVTEERWVFLAMLYAVGEEVETR